MAIDLEERRRRRQQRMAVDAASQIIQEAAGRRKTITLEWAVITALVALAAGLLLAARYRHLAAPLVGASAWAGMVLGLLISHALLQPGRARLLHLALAVFSGLPLAAIPFRFVPPERTELPVMATAALGGASLAVALRRSWDLRQSAGSPGAAVAALSAGLSKAGAATAGWLHDAILKWIVSLLLLLAGSGAGFVGRQQQRDLLFWGGFALVCLIGSVGLWVPGLRKRQSPAVALRHCGQLCFWLSLLVVPFAELGPSGNLPYTAQPSLRFLAVGLGLVLVGATWLLQRRSIFSHYLQPEPKRPPERAGALVIVVVGLAATLLGADMRERMKLTVDQSVVSQTSLLGSVHFQPAAQVVALSIIQPLRELPIYIDEVEFQDGSHLRLIPMLYPGDQRQADRHGLVNAIRAAAQLNTQSFPERGIERWTRDGGPRG